MRFPAAALLVVLPLAAQTFDPTMPASVPAVAGPVVEMYGLRYIDVKVGDGAPAKAGQEFTVHYTGWLRDGTKFDSSIGKTPLSFVQGRRKVIAGWDSGFEGMKVGGQRRLFIPYQLAYGELGRRPTIPAKAELVFDVELLGVKDVPPPPSAGSDLAMPLAEGLESEVMELAKAVPEDKYSWSPAPGVRNFQQVFLHIAYGNRLMLMMAGGRAGDDALRKQSEENTKNEQQPISKAKVLEELASSFAALHQAINSASDNSLSREVKIFDTTTTNRAELIKLETHIAEHLGQAVAYARMNGIVPPWSK
jgi:uncharacterized damage-inducible protein DinB